MPKKSNKEVVIHEYTEDQLTAKVKQSVGSSVFTIDLYCNGRLVSTLAPFFNSETAIEESIKYVQDELKHYTKH